MFRRHHLELELLQPPHLLVTESDVDFNHVRDALSEEIKPRGIVERMYVADIAHLTWEILRLRSCKTSIINWQILRTALKDVVQSLLYQTGEYEDDDRREEAERLSRGWFSGVGAVREVHALLQRFGLDESAIVAEAIRRSAADIERFDKLLASVESRRNKALRCVAEYRGGFAQQLRASSNRIIDSEPLALEQANDEESSAEGSGNGEQATESR